MNIKTSEVKPKDRQFLCDEPVRNTILGNKKGYMIKVRLTSYRALPLSCVESISLNVDGQDIPEEKITFVLNGNRYQLNEMSNLSHIWWFILDYADLFVESETELTPGDHKIDATLVTVEPYVTGGRFSFFYPSKKTLKVYSDDLGGVE